MNVSKAYFPPRARKPSPVSAAASMTGCTEESELTFTAGKYDLKGDDLGP